MKKLLPLALVAALPIAAAAQSQLYPQHFDLEQVRLLDGPLKSAMDTNNRLLLEYDVDRLLTPFVREAGLNSGKYENWVANHPTFINWGDSSWSLEGHVGGHYLTALSLAYSACNDKEMKAKLKERLDYMLAVLDDCQNAYDDNTEGMKGFIGGQPITQIWTGLYSGDLTQFKKYGGWVPFYCQHKVLAGLRDAWLYAGSEKARNMFRELCDWHILVVSNLTDEQMQRVLDWEHGGVNETLADAYHIFGDSKYLDAAKRYSHLRFINGMQTADGTYNQSFLDNKHANTQVPKYIGFERIYQEDKAAQEYRTAAHNFWHDVADHRTVCIGGNSVSEHFLPSAKAAEYLNNLEGPESCNSNNMLKLSENLFDETHDARYADFYENTLWNHILSTQDPQTGGYVYFTSLRPQSYKIYSQVNQGMWCCVGTGMENHGKYGHFIYTHTPDNSKLFVNLFTPSELSSKKFGLRQETQFPYSQTSKITLTKGGKFTLALRHPAWAGEGFEVKVNGKPVEANVTSGEASYVEINRKWRNGDVVEVSLPMQLRYEECPNYSDYVAFKYGPILLGARTSAASENDGSGLDFEPLPNEYGREGRMDHSPGAMASRLPLSSAPLLIGNRNDVLSCIDMESADPSRLRFPIKSNSNEVGKKSWQQLTLEPFYGIHHSRYSIYWYSNTYEAYQNSDMGLRDAREAALALRTLDFVATGEQQSEAGHQASHNASGSGSWNGEFYRDASANEGYIEYVLDNRAQTDSLAFMCRFTANDRGRKATIYCNDEKIGDIEILKKYSNLDNTFFEQEIPIPAEVAARAAGSLKFRISADQGTPIPGLYYLRLVTSPKN